MTHEDLADVPAVDGVRLTLLSPGYFSQGGRYVAEPDARGYRQQPGLTGTATLRLETGVPDEVRGAFAALARSAEYCGTGAQVTHGFGATRATLPQSSWSSPAADVTRGLATRRPKSRAQKRRA